MWNYGAAYPYNQQWQGQSQHQQQVYTFPWWMQQQQQQIQAGQKNQAPAYPKIKAQRQAPATKPIQQAGGGGYLKNSIAFTQQAQGAPPPNYGKLNAPYYGINQQRTFGYGNPQAQAYQNLSQSRSQSK